MPSVEQVSVVIPAHNRAAAIGACLESVRQQTYPHWELIVVDDGSADGTAEIVRALEKREPRFRLIRHDRNRGAQAARNTGVRAARGQWIAFLDSDDQYTAQSIELRLAHALARNVDVVHSDCDVLSADGVRRRFGVPPMAGRVYRDLLARPGPMFPGLLVRKAALLRIGALDEAMVAYQEWDTSIRLAEHYEFGYVEQPTFVYDRRAQDTISSNPLRGARGYEQVVRKHRRSVLRHAGPSVLARHYHALSTLFARAGDLKGALRTGLLALLWSPFRLLDAWRPAALEPKP
jgi:glycosyltransferase involved in cell wall biosynthesis